MSRLTDGVKKIMYFSLSLPYVFPVPSEWHPREVSGPFNSLSRGKFASVDAAHAWAASQLNGGAYRVTCHDVLTTTRVTFSDTGCDAWCLTIDGMPIAAYACLGELLEVCREYLFA